MFEKSYGSYAKSSIQQSTISFLIKSQRAYVQMTKMQCKIMIPMKMTLLG